LRCIIGRDTLIKTVSNRINSIHRRRKLVKHLTLTYPLLLSFGLGESIALAGEQPPAIEVIHTKIPGHPSSVIPGAMDLNGDPAFGEFRSLNNIIGSPDGSHWLLNGRSQQGTELEVIMLLGSGTDGSVFVQRGQPVHGGAPGEVYDFMSSGIGRFNDNNDFAFAARAKGGASNTAQKVIRVINGQAQIVLQQSDPYIGLQDFPGLPAGDELVGNSVGSVHLLNDGTIGVHDGTIQNVHSSFRPALFYNNIAFQQINVSNFLGIDGKANETWINIDSNTFYTTPSTTPISLGQNDSWIARGRKLGQSFPDDVLVVNGQAVLESGIQIEGSPIVVQRVFQSHLMSNGDWYSRGNADGGKRVWVVRNGQVIAKTDDFIAGTEERWADSFVQFTGNNNGDWVLIGKTSNPDLTRNEVIVVNNRVVARKGDPIDLSGNGEFDDDVFIGRSNPNAAAFNGEAYLADDGMLYFFANIMDSEGNEYNVDPPFGAPTAFLRLDTTPLDPCVGDLNNDSVVNVSDLLILLAAWGPCDGCDEDLNDDGVVNVSDLLILLGNWGLCE